jgi:hypothetical protein
MALILFDLLKKLQVFQKGFKLKYLKRFASGKLAFLLDNFFLEIFLIPKDGRNLNNFELVSSFFHNLGMSINFYGMSNILITPFTHISYYYN